MEADVLLLDEPLGALDEARKQELRRELHGLLDRLGTTALIVSHDLRDAQALADGLIVMDAGRVLQFGPLRDVLSQPVTAFVAAMVGWVRLVDGPLVDGRVSEDGVGAIELPPAAESVPPHAERVRIMAHPSTLLGVPRGRGLGSGAHGTVTATRPDGPLHVLEVALGRANDPATRYVHVRWEWSPEPPALPRPRRGATAGGAHAPEVDEAQRRALGASASRFFRLATSYGERRSPPAVVVMCGLPATGKSTVAGTLAGRIGAAYASSDIVRKQLVGVDPRERADEAFRAGLYAPEMTSAPTTSYDTAPKSTSPPAARWSSTRCTGGPRSATPRGRSQPSTACHASSSSCASRSRRPAPASRDASTTRCAPRTPPRTCTRHSASASSPSRTPRAPRSSSTHRGRRGRWRARSPRRWRAGLLDASALQWESPPNHRGRWGCPDGLRGVTSANPWNLITFIRA